MALSTKRISIKILFTNTGPWGTGSATVVDGVMNSLIERGHQVQVIFPDSGFKSPDFYRYYRNPDKFCILKFPLSHNGEHLYTFSLIITDPHPRNYRHAWTFRDLTQSQLEAYMHYFGNFTEEIIADFQPDIIECQHIWIMDYVIEKQGHRYISVAHHSDQIGFRYDERMREYALEAAKNASFIFAISESVKREVLELYPVESDRVAILPNGYDQSLFYPKKVNRDELLAQFKLEEYRDTPIITFAGKISKTKGVDYLLMANKIIQREREAVLLLFGAGKFEDVLDSDWPNKYEFKNVVKMGHQTHEILSSFHNIARLSVLPSRSEGFGIAALEAMGCGTPVVASQTGGLAELAVGAVTPVGDIEEIAKQVLNILKMTDTEYEELRDNAHKKALKYSWNDIVDRRLAIYREVIG